MSNVKKRVATRNLGPVYRNQVIGGLTVPRFRIPVHEAKLSQDAISKAFKAAKPSEIIKDFLYLSGASTAANGDLLARNKITHIINISPCRNFFESKIPLLQKYPHWKPPKYLRLYVRDVPGENIEKFFNASVSNRFLYEANRERGRVLVYCWAGVSRSASLILAYLMNQYEYTYNNAFNYLKRRRSIIEPNWGFCLQLSRYELDLTRALGVPIDGTSGTKRKYNEIECVDMKVDVGSVVEEGEGNAFDWGTKGIFDPSTYRYNKMRKLI